MIRFLINNVLIIFFIFFFENTDASEVNKIVVKVNEKIITSYEVKNKINTELVLRNLEINQSNINKMKNFALRSLIDFKVKQNEISKYSSIELDNINVSKQLSFISQGNIENFKKKFLDNNLNYDIFLKEQKIQVAWQNVVLLLFRDKVKINENELLAEINNLKKEKSTIKTYNLSEIEVSFANIVEKEEKIKKIKESFKEIGFNQTVSIFSESDSVLNNGQLGFIDEKSFSEEIYNNLKNLNKGDISEPIIQLNKITFLKVNEIKILKNQELNIEKLKQDLINKKTNNLLTLYSKSHLSKLKNNTFIEFK
jgi:peptidyl-prolyl cis-trans isomerase SurA